MLEYDIYLYIVVTDEVVYDDSSQLQTVVEIWDRYKEQYQLEAKLARHPREEGIILKEYKVRNTVVSSL